jgi:hypothetical protein
MTDMKLYTVVMIVMFIGSFGTIAYSDFTKNNCRVVGMQQSYDVEKINAICK